MFDIMLLFLLNNKINDNDIRGEVKNSFLIVMIDELNGFLSGRVKAKHPINLAL